MDTMDERDQFILEFYKVSWNNINKHRESLWKVLAPYLGFYAIFSYGFDKIGILGIILILFGLNTFIMAVSINFNLWFVRNMAIITNIETYFLKEGDYGKLIPEDYKEKLKFKRPREIWIFVFYCILTVHVVAYIISMKYFVLESIWREYCIQSIVISISFFVSLFFIKWWLNYHERRYDDFVKNAVGYAESSGSV